MSHRDSDSSDSSSSSQFAAPLPQKVRRVRRQTFCDAWLQNEKFKPWLERCEDKYKANCNVCNKRIVAGKSELWRHMNSTLHNVNMVKNTIDNKEGILLTSAKSKELDLLKKVKQAEVRICLDIVEYNRSFHCFQHFVELCKSTWPDSSIAKNMTLKRTKIAAIIKNVINKSIVLTKIDILRNKYFSILIDETSDASHIKTLCILAKYFHDGEIKTYLLDLLRVQDATGENLHKCLMHVLDEYQLSVKNIVGICIDDANVMLGKDNSLISHMKQINEEIAVFPCTCHSIYLVAHHACSALPNDMEELLHLIYTYFSKSPKRQKVLENIQTFMQKKQHKMIQPSMRRWVAVSECVTRVVNQWRVLYSLFAEASIEDGSKTAKLILDIFNAPFTKIYLDFLKYILPIFVDFNICFQSNKILINRLYPGCLRFLRSLGSKFLKSSCITDNLFTLDINNEENLLPLQSIIIGADATELLTEIQNSNAEDDNDNIIEFYTNVQQFYKTAFTESIKRLPINVNFLQSLQFLNPTIALDATKHAKILLEPLLDTYKSKFHRSAILNEWQVLPFYFSATEKEELMHLDIDKFWSKINITKNLSNELVFKSIADLAFLCLSLPHSNADVERYFSTVTQIKTKVRNKLHLDTVCALTRIQSEFHAEKTNSYTYEIRENMLGLFNSDIYKKRIIPQQLAGILLPDGSNISDSEQSDN